MLEQRNKPIGGYFGWELPKRKYLFPHEDGVLVNSGHGALQIILKTIGKASNVWIPYYTCDIVADALKAIGCQIKFYHIGHDFKISEMPCLGKYDYLLYTNYFGIMDGYINELGLQFEDKLIVDNAQALFAHPVSYCHNIYSPRKFVGIPDGGIAVSPMRIDVTILPESTSYDSCSHLLKRMEGNVSDGYSDFKANSIRLKEAPLSRMSELTKKLLSSVDFSEVQTTRTNNFLYLHSQLGDDNILAFFQQPQWKGTFECPMVYPYYSSDESLRAKLINNKIFVAQYWPIVLKWCNSGDVEYDLCQHIIPLPIDQRYDKNDMDIIIKIIKNNEQKI